MSIQFNKPGFYRRDFLKYSAAAAAGVGSFSCAGGAKKGSESEKISSTDSGKRPNILIITTDQQWAGAMSCEGNPYLKTPAMDSLAREGKVFENTYCSNPICVPSRASYMTGMAPHKMGVTHNLSEGDVEFTAPCLGKYFKDAGYDTGYVGKWHVPRDIRDRQWSGFDFLAQLKDNEVDPLIPEPAAKFIKQKRDKPFLLFASFVNPHDICEWARMASDIEDHLKNGDIGKVPPPQDCPPMRANREIPQGEPPAIREHQQFEGLLGQYPTRDWDKDDGRWRQYLWAYYRMVEKVDMYIGQVLDALDESGKRNDTLVIFTSDHGDGIGSHRWNQKSLFYDEVAKVPFIVSRPGHTPGGSRSRQLVNLGTDMAATMLDAARIPQPAYLPGISVLAAAMGKENAPANEYVVSENNLHRGWALQGDVDGRMVRSQRYKYTVYTNTSPAEQLFDMELDPGETRDLAMKPQYQDVLRQHRRMLKDYHRLWESL
jgi:arylsulfatase A-like enzyme